MLSSKLRLVCCALTLHALCCSVTIAQASQPAATTTVPSVGTPPPLTATATPLTGDALDSALARRELAKKEQRVFKLGFSIGWRQLLGSDETLRRDVVINPATNFAHFEAMDHGAVMASGVLAVFPRKRKAVCTGRCRQGLGWRFGFLANVKLATFGADEVTTFNQSIEGGIGPMVRLSDDFGMALTIERVFSRRARSFIVPGQFVYDSADTLTRKPLTSLDPTDSRFFVADNLTAFSFKFVYFLR